MYVHLIVLCGQNPTFCMIRFLPGDAVLVERRKEAKTGDIVIAEVDGDWTMKVFRKRGRRVRLEPANPHYPTIIPKQHLRIAAVVIAMIRHYPT